MGAPFHYKLKQHNCWLLPERMIYWEEEKTLIVSDLHFGKTGHFRKAGIAVPASVYKEDMQRLMSQLQYFQPRHLVIVGDMFHSSANKELEFFIKWRNDFPHIDFQLVKGNHDILDPQWYREAGIVIVNEEMTIHDFSFVHDIKRTGSAALPAGNYIFSGHIHPGIRVSGGGRQTLAFPCFYFTTSYCVLPAFSRFTGLAMVRPKEEDQVFAIVNQSIIAL
ncbi:MAG: ligase-associated DNA damage response endonuclease PdeM [Bacteroidota bacterium]